MTSTVASRTIRSMPFRDALQTWEAIVSLLSPNGETKKELLKVSGIAASIIADMTPEDSPIVATCDGPRTRVYCLYNEDAVDGSDAREDVLGYNALQGNWALSLPCHRDDLSWIRDALAKHSARITARETGTEVTSATDKSSESAVLSVDLERFLKE